MTGVSEQGKSGLLWTIFEGEPFCSRRIASFSTQDEARQYMNLQKELSDSKAEVAELTEHWEHCRDGLAAEKLRADNAEKLAGVLKEALDLWSGHEPSESSSGSGHVVCRFCNCCCDEHYFTDGPKKGQTRCDSGHDADCPVTKTATALSLTTQTQERWISIDEFEKLKAQLDQYAIDHPTICYQCAKVVQEKP